jgi:ATP/maltotriose-dependent transcriptional regulator MalT
MGHFTPRPSELEALEHHFLLPPQPDSRQIFVIHGLGGIGKTQLALEFARRHKDDYSAVFWLNGSDSKSLERSLAVAAGRILFNYSGDEPSTNAIEENAEDLAKTALRWLSRSGNYNWLLIYDDCDNLESKSGEYTLDYLKSQFPEADHGCILVTTRRVQLSFLGTSDRIVER